MAVWLLEGNAPGTCANAVKAVKAVKTVKATDMADAGFRPSG